MFEHLLPETDIPFVQHNGLIDVEINSGLVGKAESRVTNKVCFQETNMAVPLSDT